jgi:RNA polymerase sigma factor (sigma-70 family)
MAAPVTATTDSKAPVAGLFATTHWSVILAAGNSGTPDSNAALERLCQTYWPPLYAYLRRFGYAPEEAEDLTQDFFAHFLEGNCFNRADPRRGRFRSFLLTCLQNYTRDLHDGRTATKRGGQTRVLSLDQERAERGYAAEPVEQVTPERVFEKRWATTLLENVLDHLGAEFTRSGKREFFDQLKCFVWGEQGTTPVRQIATEFGVSESAVRVTVHRLRQRFRELLRLEIAHTVTESAEIDEEIRYLAQVLRER